MILGSELGRYVLGELPGTNAAASGSVLTVNVSIVAGAADGQLGTLRAGGPVGYQKKIKWEIDAQAFGAVIVLAPRLFAGLAFGEVNVEPTPPIAPDLDFEPIESQILEEKADPVLIAGTAVGDAAAQGSVLFHKSWTKYDNELVVLL